jgi:hypothetical protein
VRHLAIPRWDRVPVDCLRKHRFQMFLTSGRRVSDVFPSVIACTLGDWNSSSLAFDLWVSPCVMVLATRLCRNPLYRHAAFTLGFPRPLSRLDLKAFAIFLQDSWNPIHLRRDTAHKARYSIILMQFRVVNYKLWSHPVVFQAPIWSERLSPEFTSSSRMPGP